MSDDMLLERSIQVTLIAFTVLFYAAAFFEPVNRVLMEVFRMLFGA